MGKRYKVGEYEIESEEEYQRVVSRVKKGVVWLNNKFFDPDPEVQRFVLVYNVLAQALLDYEIKTGKLDQMMGPTSND